MELAEADDIFVRDVALRRLLLHVLHRLWLPEELLDLDDVHDVLDHRLVTVPSLPHVLLYCCSLLLGQADGLQCGGHRIVPFFLLPSNMVELFEFLGSSKLDFLKANWVHIEQLFVKVLDFDCVCQRWCLDDIRVRADHTKQITFFADHGPPFL